MCGETVGFWPGNWEWVPVCVGEMSSLQCDGYPYLHRLRRPFVNDKLFSCAIVDVLAALASCSLGYPLDKDKLVPCAKVYVERIVMSALRSFGIF